MARWWTRRTASGTSPTCARARIGRGHRSVLGRETALQQVDWTDDGWLRLTTGGTVAAAGDAVAGRRDAERLLPLRRSPRTDFRGPGLDLWFSTLRRPRDARTGSRLADRRSGHARCVAASRVTSRHESSVVATPLQGFAPPSRPASSVAPHHFSQSAGLLVIYDERTPLRPGLPQREPRAPGWPPCSWWRTA